MFGKHILILVPHPDDEIVACAASIARAQAQGADVSALYLTHGCLARENLWPWQRKQYESLIARRRAEAEQAAKFLGLTPLGFSQRPARYLWTSLPEVYAEIDAILAAHRPDQVWLPAYEGGNPDHDGLNGIGRKLAGRVSVLEFAEYHFFGGKAGAQCFIAEDDATRIIELTPSERMRKREALKIYASEAQNLGYVGTEQESFRPLAHYDYSLSPHQGTLWYARFQWVPFRHPRVDFTDPAEVSQAIATFLSA